MAKMHGGEGGGGGGGGGGDGDGDVRIREHPQQSTSLPKSKENQNWRKMEQQRRRRRKMERERKGKGEREGGRRGGRRRNRVQYTKSGKVMPQSWVEFNERRQFRVSRPCPIPQPPKDDYYQPTTHDKGNILFFLLSPFSSLLSPLFSLSLSFASLLLFSQC